MSVELVKASLDRISCFEDVANGVRLNSQCLYPNNGFVRVLVMGAGGDFYVSDEGGAFREATQSGACELDFPDRKFRKAMAAQGLQMDGGIIRSPSVNLDALPTAIALVANASKETAEWLFDHWKLERTRKFKEQLKELLKTQYNDVNQQSITGVSSKPHTFDNVIQLSNGKRLLVDAVIKDSNSMNSRVVANLDVKRAEHQSLVQTIVYDDEEDWGAADLSLLQVSSVPVIAFSKARPALTTLLARSYANG